MDPISDLLTRIRNASSAKHEKVDVPNSRLKEGVVKAMKDAGFVKNFRVVKDNRQGLMRVYLKYTDAGAPVISGLKRESKPGRRVYVSADNLPRVQSGFGLAIVSTNKGVLSSEDAKKQNIGGEYLFSMW